MRKAFTLIELLVVILLITIIISMAAPRGIKLYDSINHKIALKQESAETKEKLFNRFINGIHNSKDLITKLFGQPVEENN